MSNRLPTPDEIAALSYVELLALLRESNRPPGGIDTVRRLVVHCHLRPELSVLHAGCNAGFLSRELARRSGCAVLGVDISPSMVKAAAQRATDEGLSTLVHHEQHDMRCLQMKDQLFDVVLSGGALAFVEGQRQAVEEWVRVTRPYGLVADAELYYREPPPAHVLAKVSEAIGVKVPKYDREHWHSAFDHELLEPYYSYEDAVVTRSNAEVRRYCERLVEYSASEWSISSKDVLVERLLGLFSLFNENLKFMNYWVFIYRRVPKASEPSLFI